MFRRSSTLMVASSVVLAALASVILVEVTSATPRVQQVETASVNRILKGDRQLVGIGRANMETPTILPDGCEPILSVITRSPLAKVARHCVS
jgi:hypothetical protein